MAGEGQNTCDLCMSTVFDISTILVMCKSEIVYISFTTDNAIVNCRPAVSEWNGKC